MIYSLKNEEILIQVDSYGAELRSLRDVKTDREYMWSADKKYWGRVSPVLFPVVGSYRDGVVRHNGNEYHMSQHGFARDMEFMMTENTAEEIWFCLTDKDETWEKYPFAFSLEIGYRLEGRSVRVLWKVSNPAEDTLYFSIGGHPAFLAPVREAGRTTCYLRFAGAPSLLARKLSDGLATEKMVKLSLEKGGILPVSEELFADDALIIENGQTGRVELLDENRDTYLIVRFEAPLFGIWSPPGKNAPFICIEPWYGRCDKADFDGELKDREWGNTLKPHEVFAASYCISV